MDILFGDRGPLRAGTFLGPYEVLGPLGSGGMGEVYRARDARLGRDVAVKVLPADSSADPDRIRRFEQEAKAAGALNHPNLLAVFDTGQHDGAPYIVFELLQGETLRARLGPLPTRKAVDYATQIAHGLAAAHERGIVHRDLKPENLFLTKDDWVKILDFGLAKLRPGHDLDDVRSGTETASKITAAGTVLGTIGYMSPEQVEGRSADHRSDIFSFGSVFYEMLAGRRAFRGNSAVETMNAILKEDPAELTQTGGSVPVVLGRIVRRCLEKRPEERFQSARDIAFALEALAASSGGWSGSPVAADHSERPLVQRMAGPTLIAGFLLAMGILVYYAFIRRSGIPTVQLTAVPFTSFPGREVAPTFSPDGSQIAFAWTGPEEAKVDQFDLYVKAIGSEEPHRLTTHPAVAIRPAWSPDGQVIAFLRVAKDSSGVYLVPATGGPERKLVDSNQGTFDLSQMSWSPDGARLAFEEGGAIALVDVATSEKRILSPTKECEWIAGPAFSPDSRSLALDCQLSTGVNKLLLMPSSGGNARQVALIGRFLGLSWAPDGGDLIFSDGALWRVSAAGGTPEKLAYAGGALDLAVSPRAHRLAYTQETSKTNIWRAEAADPRRAGKPPVRIVASSGGQQQPSFSPDGSRIVFASARSGRPEIWLSNADGSDPVRLTSGVGAETGSPRWSPDGKQVVFDSRASLESDIYVVRRDGGPPRRVATGVANSSQPNWSTDGRWLYFTANVDGVGQIWRVPAEGGVATQMTKRGGFSPFALPDGQRLYYIHPGDNRAEIWSMSAQGGDERPVSGMPGLPVNFSDWVPAASGVYFVDSESPRPGIAFFAFATGRIQRVADIPGRPAPWVGGLTVSPDGRTILFSQLDEIASDIMLVENFH